MPLVSEVPTTSASRMDLPRTLQMRGSRILTKLTLLSLKQSVRVLKKPEETVTVSPCLTML